MIILRNIIKFIIFSVLFSKAGFTQITPRVFDSLAKTIQIHKENDQLSYPYINLGSNEKLSIAFDYISPEIKSFSYTITHCNSNWRQSNLQTFEYFEGFESSQINNFENSLNTTVQYTHYWFSLPNDDMAITKSGNYIITVFNLDTNDTIFQQRFVVYEQLVEIDCNIQRASRVEFSDEKQEVDFKLDISQYEIDDPYRNLKVTVLQNGIWETGIYSLKPLYIKQNSIEYDYEEENLFDGFNEFHLINFKNFKYNYEQTKSIEYTSTYQINLRADSDRRFKVYMENPDFNGKSSIYVELFDDPNVSADYAYVNFELNLEKQIYEGALYIWGALTNWQCNNSNMLQYDEKSETYKCSLLLKQGYHDYQYVFKQGEQSKPDQKYIEGSHYQTENDYIIFVYYWDKFQQFDRLIGYKKSNSTKN